jgi:hypothetical protein
MKKALLLLAFLFISSTLLYAQHERYSRTVIYFDGRSIQDLASEGIDVLEGVLRKGHSFTTDLEAREIEKLRQSGFRLEILIDDTEQWYRERAKSDRSGSSVHKAAANGCQGAGVDNGPDYPQPQNFQLGSYAGFFTYQEMLDQLDSMRLLYPNLITAKQGIPGGTSIEGDSILWIRVSDNPDVDEAEPEVLYTALHHAREPGGLSALIYYLWYVLENYNSDPNIQALINSTEMYFVPCINPDGYKYNELTDPLGGGLWRKNRRDNGDGTFGVDLNRNYAFQWGFDDIGSSPVTDDFTYRGTAPASEPEIQLMNDFVNSRQFRLALNYHTFGNLLINPWGYIPNFYTDDSLIFDAMGEAMTVYNNYLNGTANQTVNYSVNGSSDDWMYGEQSTKPKVFAFTPECGNSSDFFWPQPARIVPICQENMWSNLLMARLAGPYADLTPDPSQQITSLSGNIRFKVQQLGLDTTGLYSVSMTALSSAILSTGNPKSYGPFSLLQLINDSLAFTLDPAIQQGDTLRFLLEINNGLYTMTDTLEYTYGNFSVLFSDAGNNTTAWTGNWTSTTNDFVSPPSSITDSPFGLYAPNSNSIFQLTSPLNLSNAVRAQLEFQARWELETDYDFVQVEASSDNGLNWTALCGRYTRDPVLHATTGPLYDGFSPWVAELIQLTDYIGQNILIRFRLGSDGAVEQDGYYFDDLEVKVITTTGNEEVLKPQEGISIFPNPARSEINFRFPSSDINGILEVSDINGKLIRRITVAKQNETLTELTSWAEGTYLYRYTGVENVYTGRFQVVH